MAQAKKNFNQKSKRMTDDADLDIAVDRKSRTTDRPVEVNRSSSVKQPASSKDKFGKREAARK